MFLQLYPAISQTNYEIDVQWRALARKTNVIWRKCQANALFVVHGESVYMRGIYGGHQLARSDKRKRLRRDPAVRHNSGPLQGDRF